MASRVESLLDALDSSASLRGSLDVIAAGTAAIREQRERLGLAPGDVRASLDDAHDALQEHAELEAEVSEAAAAHAERDGEDEALLAELDALVAAAGGAPAAAAEAADYGVRAAPGGADAAAAGGAGAQPLPAAPRSAAPA